MADNNIIQFPLDGNKNNINKKFEELKKYIGEEVLINTVYHGSRRSLEKRIIGVDNEYLHTDGISIPFVGMDGVIINVVTLQEKIIYNNALAEDKYLYNEPTKKRIEDVQNYVYGSKYTIEKKKILLEAEKKAAETLKELIEYGENNKYKFMHEGIELVKPELICEWFEFVEVNVANGDGEMVEAIITTMKNVENNEDKPINYSLTGFIKSILEAYVLRYYKNSDKYKEQLMEKERRRQLGKKIFVEE